MFSRNRLYVNQIKNVSELKIDWDRFKNKSFFITGGTGLLGTFLVDLLMFLNQQHGFNIRIFVVGRNEENAKTRFNGYWENEFFSFIKHDINLPILLNINCDFIIHGASNTHPIAYAADPIGTITANVIGTYNVLEFSIKQTNPKVVFLSSVEIYGENRGDTDKFEESYCGYIDCNTLRAGYPESKRLGEALCQAYIKSKNLNIVIPRLSRVYGPTMSPDDSKAIAQFIKKAAKKEAIVLKSKGDQFYSYTYVADAVTALIYILLYGNCGEAYNISDEKSEITLGALAEMLADIAGTKVLFEMPDETETSGYSKATYAILDNTKIKSLNWESAYSINEGLKQTLKILISEDLAI